MVEKVLDITQQIGRFPFAGRIGPELKQEAIRERFVYSYRIVYRVAGSRATIAAIIHGRRLFDAVTGRFVEQ